jgi:hypothetical protein
MLDRIVAVEARPDYHVWIRFEDGLEGELSLAHLVGRGVFVAWNDEAEFRKVFIDEESGTIAWPGGLDVAPDALHQRLAESHSAAPSSRG